MATAFLITQVKGPNQDDWKKLKRVLSFVKGTLDDVRIIGATNLQSIFMFVDASYAVYANMRGQTGGCLSMGHGVFHAKSSKQKINTKSSTETELVGVGEYLPYDLWALHFIEAQGYEIDENILFSVL